MIDELFELLMKEARAQEEVDLRIAALLILLDLQNRVFDAFKLEKLNERMGKNNE